MSGHLSAEEEARARIVALRTQAAHRRVDAEEEQNRADRARQDARDLDAQAASWELLLEAAARSASPADASGAS